MQISVLHDNVLLKRLDADEKSKGGILIPLQAQEKPITCTVLRVGPGNLISNGTHLVRRPMSVKEGDTVIVKKFAGMDISMTKLPDDLLFVKDDEILCVLDYEANA